VVSVTEQAPQSIAVQLTTKGSGKTGSQTIVAGWTGLSSSLESVTSHLSSRSTNGLGSDRVEIDPQYAEMFGFGLSEGSQVRLSLSLSLFRNMWGSSRIDALTQTCV
jgi:hypothetical protein